VAPRPGATTVLRSYELSEALMRKAKKAKPQLDLAHDNRSPAMRLDLYQPRQLDRGRALWVELLWLIAQLLVLTSPISCNALRRFVLTLFGAKIGHKVTIKPGVRVKFPWRLEIGNNCWIGEGVWLDNLANITIGNHCCISQGAYLCTGSHNWRSIEFELIVKPILLEDGVWLAARSTVGPGVAAGQGAVLSLGSVATQDLAPYQIHQGVPALPIKAREVIASNRAERSS
jgi:putative colanic acid biosynthesis acetyltransferase WcaF